MMGKMKKMKILMMKNPQIQKMMKNSRMKRMMAKSVIKMLHMKNKNLSNDPIIKINKITRS